MVSLATPAETRAYIVERLTGDTGEPDHVLKTAQSLAERALPAVRANLADTMPVPLSVELGEVDLSRFAGVKDIDPDLHALVVAPSPSSADALMLVADAKAVSVLVNALFGGDPDLPVPAIRRPLSPLELEVVDIAFEIVARAANGSGSRAFDFKLPLHPSISGADLRKQVVRDGPAVRIELLLGPQGEEGRIWALMPQRVLLKHRSVAPTVSLGADEWNERFTEEVKRSTITLDATMQLAPMTLGDISRLQAGQVLAFDEAAGTEARLTVKNQVLFVCDFGKLGQNYTVRVRQTFDARQDLVDGLLPG